MFGIYNNFPQKMHKNIFFQSKNSRIENQKALFKAIYDLNSCELDLKEISPFMKANYLVSFEFGVADGNYFNYLTQIEFERCIRKIVNYEIDTLDFFFVTRYHDIKDSFKRVPLRFDYFVIRFVFFETNFESMIRHEKGIRRISFEDLICFLIEQVNNELFSSNKFPIQINNSKNIK